MSDWQVWGREVPTAEGMVEISQRAEELGYYAVGLSWITTLTASYGEGEGLVKGWKLMMEEDPGHYMDSLAVLPMIAQTTHTIRFGLNTFIPPALHPFYIAKYLATLDVASDGRLTTAFGFGVTEEDGTSRMFEWLGSTIPANRRGLASEEALEVITRLWSESEPLDHEGEFSSASRCWWSQSPFRNPIPSSGGLESASGRSVGRPVRKIPGTLWRDARVHGRAASARAHSRVLRIRAGRGECAVGRLCEIVRLDPRVMERPVNVPVSGRSFYWYEDRPEIAGIHEAAAGWLARAVRRGDPSSLRDAGVDHFVLDFTHQGYQVAEIRDRASRGVGYRRDALI